MNFEVLMPTVLELEINLWITYEWNEPNNSEKRIQMTSLLCDLQILQLGMRIKPGCNETVASKLKQICEVVRSTNQDFTEEIQLLILLHSL